MNHVIEEALREYLEEFEDIHDLKQIRNETTRPLAELLSELQLDGNL